MFDIMALVGKTKLYNLHGHTQFCDGHADMEDFILEAIDKGFTHYGFTPHAPIQIESPCNMNIEQMDNYLSEIARLRSKYGDKIQILCGLEIDFIDGHGPSDGYFQSLALDYRIGSVHFIPSLHTPDVMIDIDGRFEHFREKMHIYFDNDIEWVVRKYFSQMTKMVEEGGFDIVGHLDKIGYNASCFRAGIDSEPWYDTLVVELIDCIMDHHYIVEINTKAWEKSKRLFPDSRYFSLLKRYQTPVVFNSDAHYPALINAGRFEAMRLYQES